MPFGEGNHARSDPHRAPKAASRIELAHLMLCTHQLLTGEERGRISGLYNGRLQSEGLYDLETPDEISREMHLGVPNSNRFRDFLSS